MCAIFVYNIHAYIETPGGSKSIINRSLAYSLANSVSTYLQKRFDDNRDSGAATEATMTMISVHNDLALLLQTER